MERFVILYWSGYESDGYDAVVPAEYESAEVLLCDIEDACKKAFAQKQSDFIVGDYEFLVSDFYPVITTGIGQFSSPTILTIDEWFEQAPEGKVTMK